VQCISSETVGGLLIRFSCTSTCSYVHGRLPYDRIARDPQLARLLQSIPQRKVVRIFRTEQMEARHFTSLGTRPYQQLQLANHVKL
jgi:hypothetical protein